MALTALFKSVQWKEQKEHTQSNSSILSKTNYFSDDLNSHKQLSESTDHLEMREVYIIPPLTTVNKEIKQLTKQALY